MSMTPFGLEMMSFKASKTYANIFFFLIKQNNF